MKGATFKTMLVVLASVMAMLGALTMDLLGPRGSLRASEPTPSAPAPHPVASLPDMEPIPGPPGIEMYRSKVTGIEFVYIPFTASFPMGSRPGDPLADDDEALRNIALSGYLISRYPITLEQFQTFDPKHRNGPYTGNGPKKPVTNVDFEDATSYAEWVCAQEKVEKGSYRLPSEAQFELSARALFPTQSKRFPSGDEPHPDWKKLFRSTHCPDVDADPDIGGLHFLAFGVLQLCRDFYAPYDPNDTVNPQGPKKDTGRRVVRGGTFYIEARSFRCADRWSVLHGTSDDRLSFRLMREIPVQPVPEPPARLTALGGGGGARVLSGPANVSSNLCVEEAMRALQSRYEISGGNPLLGWPARSYGPNGATGGEDPGPYPPDGFYCWDRAEEKLTGSTGETERLLVQDLADKLADEVVIGRFVDQIEGQSNIVYYSTNQLAAVTNITVTNYFEPFMQLAGYLPRLNQFLTPAGTTNVRSRGIFVLGTNATDVIQCAVEHLDSVPYGYDEIRQVGAPPTNVVVAHRGALQRWAITTPGDCRHVDPTNALQQPFDNGTIGAGLLTASFGPGGQSKQAFAANTKGTYTADLRKYTNGTAEAQFFLKLGIFNQRPLPQVVLGTNASVIGQNEPISPAGVYVQRSLVAVGSFATLDDFGDQGVAAAGTCPLNKTDGSGWQFDDAQLLLSFSQFPHEFHGDCDTNAVCAAPKIVFTIPSTNFLITCVGITNILECLVTLSDGTTPITQGNVTWADVNSLGTFSNNVSTVALNAQGKARTAWIGNTAGIGTITAQGTQLKDASNAVLPDSNTTNITAQVVNVDSVEFVTDGTTGDLTNDNPEGVPADDVNFGGGWRFFPDAISQTGPSRNHVRVRAVISPAVAAITNTPIYFRSFDVDDPSTSTVLDPEGANGRDNRGRVTGGDLDTPDTPRPPAAGGYRGRLRPIGVAAASFNAEGAAVMAKTFMTNGQVFAEAELAASFQPGDNFRVVATCDAQEVQKLNDLSSVPFNGTVANFRGQATKQLSVWRKLYVETDSMTTAAGGVDTVLGNVTKIASSPGYGAATVDVDLTFGGTDRSRNLNRGGPGGRVGNGRFENGRILIGTLGGGTITTNLVGNGNSTIIAPSAFSIPFTISKAGVPPASGTVTQFQPAGGDTQVRITPALSSARIYNGGEINIAGHVFTVASHARTLVTIAGTGHKLSFALVDDDDVSLLPFTSTFSLFNTKRLFGNPNALYRSAYIEAVAAPSNPRATIPFHANARDLEANTLASASKDLSSKAIFWVVHIVSAFQGEFIEDNDPSSEPETLAFSPGSVLMYREVIRDAGLQRGYSATEEERRTEAHEVGHRFLLFHPRTSGFPDDDIMTEDGPTPDGKVQFNDQNLNLIRTRLFPPQ